MGLFAQAFVLYISHARSVSLHILVVTGDIFGILRHILHEEDSSQWILRFP